MVIKNCCFLVFLSFVYSLDVLPDVQKCHLDDSPCLVTAFQKAVPVFVSGLKDQGVEVLDVMELDDVGFDLSGLQFSATKGQLKGLKTTIIDDVKWDLKKKKISIAWHLNCSVKSQYKAGGRVLILPITGDGQMKLKLKNVKINLHIDYEMEKLDDGKNHVIPKKYNLDFDVIDGAHFYLTNLFNGNKELSDAMLFFLNDNWKQISAEFGKPMMDVAAKKIYKNVQNFLRSVPIDEISLM